MVSLESALGHLAEAKGQLYALLQDSDQGEDSLISGIWADHMYHSIELITEAMQQIDLARTYDDLPPAA